MDTRTVAELRILTPGLDRRDLDPIEEPPVDDMTEALVEGACWRGNELDAAQVRQSYLIGVDLGDAAWRAVTVQGCRFERVDLSGARLDGLTLDRCEFIGCRMTGLQLINSTIRNVIVEDCRLDYASLVRVRATGAVAITGCSLDRARLDGCTLPGAAVTNCPMAAIELVDCVLRDADLRGSDLSTLSGLASLRGAVIGAEQLAPLAEILVRELSLRVR